MYVEKLHVGGGKGSSERRTTMKVTAAALLVTALSRTVTLAFSPPAGFAAARAAFTRVSMSTVETAATVIPFQHGPRVIRDELPIVYVYDHCPFCVRVRLALGIKNVKHSLHFLANDDVATPTKLIGKKISPIVVSKESFFILDILFEYTSSLFLTIVVLTSSCQTSQQPRRCKKSTGLPRGQSRNGRESRYYCKGR